MKARVASPDALVDLNGIDELKGIELDREGGLEIGAMTTYSELVASAEARARPIIGEVCAQIADVQVRNRGTIGGNVCANDPTNHLPPLMVALNARMTIAGDGGERTVDADDFFLGVYMTEVGPGEILTKISIPPGRRDGFASITIGEDGTCLVNARGLARRRDESRDRLRRRGAPPGHRRRGAAERRSQPRGGASGGERARRDTRSAGRRPCAGVLPAAPRRGRRGSGDRRGRPARRRAVTAIETSRRITVEVNGVSYERDVEARRLLIHFLRDDLDLTGSHIGCDTGNCGACSVICDGTLVKSCMMLAVQADGSSVRTVEGLAPDGELTPLQQAFHEHHALQCGYCTPGMLISATSLLERKPTDDEIRKGLQGNICRCTGYWNIIKAVKAASGQEVAE